MGSLKSIRTAGSSGTYGGLPNITSNECLKNLNGKGGKQSLKKEQHAFRKIQKESRSPLRKKGGGPSLGQLLIRGGIRPKRARKSRWEKFYLLHPVKKTGVFGEKGHFAGIVV